MHRIVTTILAALLLAICARAQDCTWCQAPRNEGDKVVHWRKHVFCSEDCRHEWYLDRYRCKICNDKVQPKSHSTTRTDGMFIYMDFTPKTWDGFCDSCREGVKDGTIDPVKDRYQEEPALDMSGEGASPAAPLAEAAAPEVEEESGESDDALVFRLLTWVVGIGVIMMLLMRKLLG